MLIWTNSIFLYMLTYISLRVDRKLIHNLRYVKKILYFVFYFIFGNAGRLRQTCIPRINPHSPSLTVALHACVWGELAPKIADRKNRA